jgi:LysM repeat protein
VNKIYVGQNLSIPLPCSCDDVDAITVVHYGLLVKNGSSVEGIAELYGTTPATLLSLNQMANVNDLKAGQVLDVPLKGSSLLFEKCLHECNWKYSNLRYSIR